MKARKFRTNGDTGVTVYATDASGSSIPIRIEPGDSFESSDKHIVVALQGSPEVTEVRDIASSTKRSERRT